MPPQIALAHFSPRAGFHWNDVEPGRDGKEAETNLAENKRSDYVRLGHVLTALIVPPFLRGESLHTSTTEDVFSKLLFNDESFYFPQSVF